MSAERPQKRKVDWWTLGPALGLMAICAAAVADSKGYTPGDIDLDFFSTKEKAEEVCRVEVEVPTHLAHIALECMAGATPEERKEAVDEVSAWQFGGSLEAKPGTVAEFPHIEAPAATTTTEAA